MNRLPHHQGIDKFLKWETSFGNNVKLIMGTSNNGMPSIKALELYYKIFGSLVDKKSIEFDDGSNRPRLTAKEVSEGLNELNAMLNREKN